MDDDFSEFSPAMQMQAAKYPNVAQTLREIQAIRASRPVRAEPSPEDVAKQKLRERLANVKPWRRESGETEKDKRNKWALGVQEKWRQDIAENGPLSSPYDWITLDDNP